MKDNRYHFSEQLTDAEDLRLIRKMKKFADDGYNVELRKAPGGGYKTLKYKKQIITTD